MGSYEDWEDDQYWVNELFESMLECRAPGFPDANSWWVCSNRNDNWKVKWIMKLRHGADMVETAHTLANVVEDNIGVIACKFKVSDDMLVIVYHNEEPMVSPRAISRLFDVCKFIPHDANTSIRHMVWKATPECPCDPIL